jgi:Tfp pilus assembly protein PilF
MPKRYVKRKIGGTFRGEGILLRKYVLALLLILVSAHIASSAQAEDQAGTADSPLLANIEMWQGSQYVQQGRMDLAADSFIKAAGHARNSPYPHFMLARLYLKRLSIDAIIEFGTGLKLMMADFATQSLAAANLMVALFIGLGIAVYLGVVTVLARHAKTIWYSLLLTFSPVFGEKQLKVISGGVVIALIAMLSGMSMLAVLTWAAVIASSLAWRYAGTSDRRMMIAFGVYLVAFGPIFSLTTSLVSTQHPSSPTRIAALAGQTTEIEFAKAAQTNTVLAENNPIGEFMRGLLCLKAGDYLASIEHFNIASKFTRTNVATLNNIAVALHNMGRYREAQVKFKEALTHGPRQALVHYNYSQTLNALLYYDLAQSELAKASSIDFDLVRSLVAVTDKPQLVPMSLDNSVLWDLAMQPGNSTFHPKYHPTESGWPGILVLIALACGAFWVVRGANLPARCDICDGLVKTEVTKRKRREVLCPDCKAVKLNNADDTDALERQLESRVQAVQTRRGIVNIALGLAVPGTAYHLLGSKIKGFVASVAVFTALVLLASGGSPIRHVPQLDMGRTYGWPLVVFAIFYGLCVWRSAVLALNVPGEE